MDNDTKCPNVIILTFYFKKEYVFFTTIKFKVKNSKWQRKKQQKRKIENKYVKEKIAAL